MAEAIALISDNPDIIKLIDYLKTPGMEKNQQEYSSLIKYVDTIENQYNSILSELTELKAQISGIKEKKNPITVMTGHLETLAADVGTKLKNLKNNILSFTKNALDTVKEKGLFALGSVFGALRVKDGLQAMSSGLAKSVAALDKAVTRVDNLEQHNLSKTAEVDVVLPTDEQSVSLSELLEDTRLDFENLSQDELQAIYEKLLAIGMDNDLTANENECLKYLVNEVSGILPDHYEYEQVAEIESEQNMEM